MGMPTLKSLAEKAHSRGVELGEQDAPGGVDRSEVNPRKDISDTILLYMVFVEDKTSYNEEASQIEIDYLISEFQLGYASAFNNKEKIGEMMEEEKTGAWFAICHRAYDAVYWGPFESLEAGRQWAEDKKINFGIGFVQMNDPESPESTWW